MNRQEFESLQPGDIVKHKTMAYSLVVTANYGGRATAVRTHDLTNPEEWDLMTKREKKPEVKPLPNVTHFYPRGTPPAYFGWYETFHPIWGTRRMLWWDGFAWYDKDTTKSNILYKTDPEVVERVWEVEWRGLREKVFIDHENTGKGTEDRKFDGVLPNKEGLPTKGIWMIETLDRGGWEATGSMGLTKKDAERIILQEWVPNFPKGNFRPRCYVPG